jgi:alkylated DNA repair protein alkB family protein 1
MSGAGQAGAGAPKTWLNDTAYRHAEKAYTHYSHKGASPTDFRGVVDFANLANNTEENCRRIRAVTPKAPCDTPLYTLEGCPGLFIAPGALSESVQRELVLECLSSYCLAPNGTNLEGHAAPETSSAPHTAAAGGEADARPGAADVALTTLRSLRWATLGYQYQWGTRSYDPAQHTPMPTGLSEICQGLCGLIGEVMDPQAAIVNYYTPKSKMGGHVDDAELDLTLPLVSLSLGLSAVFLFGGTTRNDVPTPIWLRSGDAMIVSGPARLCYHGVPRIVSGSCPSTLLEPARYDSDASLLSAGAPSLETVCEFMPSCRLNVNVRQVTSEGSHQAPPGGASSGGGSALSLDFQPRAVSDAMSSVLGMASSRLDEGGAMPTLASQPIEIVSEITAGRDKVTAEAAARGSEIASVS